jgi:hypothetical protein
VLTTSGVTATFDGDTITNNGGGLHTDTTNAPVSVDISNSTISYNVNNGIAIVTGPGGSNTVNFSHDVVASNGQAGIEASGIFAIAFVDTTLLDRNAAGATAAPNGGKLITYNNNRIIGGLGSGFTGSLPPN